VTYLAEFHFINSTVFPPRQPQFQMKHPILSSASLKLQRNYRNGKGEISNDSLSTEEVMTHEGGWSKVHTIFYPADV
jgi:hypothetical protein